MKELIQLLNSFSIADLLKKFTDFYEIIKKYPLLALICSGVIYFGKLFLEKRNQIQLNKKVEKIKYEMDCKRLQMQQKTIIYKKLYELILQCGHLINLFDCINKKRHEFSEGFKNAEEIRSLITDCFEFLEVDLGLQAIRLFTDYLESNSLLISNSIKEQAEGIRSKMMGLYFLVKNEIVFSKNYQEYTYDELVNLLDKADKIIMQLTLDKNVLYGQMNK